MKIICKIKKRKIFKINNCKNKKIMETKLNSM